MNGKPLYWDDSLEIIFALQVAHPKTDVDSIGIEQLYRWIIELPNFADDPKLANEGILRDILREWYEEIS